LKSKSWWVGTQWRLSFMGILSMRAAGTGDSESVDVGGDGGRDAA
jgi:hypothetical protein